MENGKIRSRTCCVLSFLIGAAVGGGIALLATPQSGKRTRDQLKRIAGEAKEKAWVCYDEMKEKSSAATEKVQGYYQEAKQTVGSAVETAKKTFQRVKE